MPIHEPGLDDLLASVQGCLTWTTSYDSVHEADVIFAGNRASPGQAVSCARSAFRKPVNFLWDKMALSGPRRLSDFHAPADLRGVALLPRPHLS
ncbi:hypothetical protein [Deinococcus sp. 23YEL01]|uniref:hypothetical protein n=1 Tax=Deinococcus sp. 23YEL01 TaxID=2745871 RepID=UPI00351D695A